MGQDEEPCRSSLQLRFATHAGKVERHPSSPLRYPQNQAAGAQETQAPKQERGAEHFERELVDEALKRAISQDSLLLQAVSSTRKWKLAPSNTRGSRVKEAGHQAVCEINFSEMPFVIGIYAGISRADHR